MPIYGKFYTEDGISAVFWGGNEMYIGYKDYASEVTVSIRIEHARMFIEALKSGLGVEVKHDGVTYCLEYNDSVFGHFIRIDNEGTVYVLPFNKEHSEDVVDIMEAALKWANR